MSFLKLAAVAALSCAYLVGCASGYKARQEQREKAAAAAGLFCEFVNGEQHPDVDVELNLQMAKRCDASRPFSITNYKTSSEMNGIVYCCQPVGTKSAARYSQPAPRPMPASTAPAVQAQVPPAAKPATPAAAAPSPDADPELVDE